MSKNHVNHQNHHRESATVGTTSHLPDQPQAHDLWSVGSRVSWPAVMAGVVITMASGALLTSLAGAIGLSTVNSETSGKTIAIAAGIVWLFIVVISLLMGGYVATRLTTREDHCEAAIIGVLVWGTTAMLIALGVGASTGLALDTAQTAKVMTADKPFWATPSATDNDQFVRDLKLTPEQNTSYQQMRDKARDAAQTTRAPSAQETAWWTFAGLLLSIMAAVGGALWGAGPEFLYRFIGAHHLVTTSRTVNRPNHPVTVAVQ